MIATSKQQFLLAIGTFILVISLISFTVIALGPTEKPTKAPTASKEGPQSVGSVEAPPTTKDDKDAKPSDKGTNPPVTVIPPKEKPGNTAPETKNPSETSTEDDGSEVQQGDSDNLVDSKVDGDDSDDQKGSKDGSGSPIETATATPVNLVFEDLHVLENTSKTHKCGSFIISGFAGENVIKVFFGVAAKTDFAGVIKTAVGNKDADFKIDKHIKDFESTPAATVGSVTIRHSPGEDDIATKITTNFATFYASIVDKYTYGFFVVIEGKKEDVAKYVLGEKWPEIVPVKAEAVVTPEAKLKVTKHKVIEVKEGLLFTSHRHYGQLEVSGFKDGIIKRIFMSVTNKNFKLYEQICKAFEVIEPEKFDRAHSFGKMKKPLIDSGAIAFDYSDYNIEKELKPDMIESNGFIYFFQNLRSTYWASLSGKDFFVILTGTEEALKDFKLGEAPATA